MQLRNRREPEDLNTLEDLTKFPLTAKKDLRQAYRLIFGNA